MVIVAVPVALDTGVNCRLPTVCGCKYETTGFGIRAGLPETAVIVRAWSSLAGPGLIPDKETTTGPLGQGFGNGVGMAIAEAHLAARYNRPGLEIVNHYTYAIVSDGDLMEGVAAEAESDNGPARCRASRPEGGSGASYTS